ncbi:MAG: helix-turn-helix domain-containing protein [Actinomycetes bacterium]
MNVVHNLNMVQLRVVADDRIARAHEAKRQRFIDAAGRIIDREGLRGVTMVAVAEELDCAVGTIYGYFRSKSALLAALQEQAVDTLRASYLMARAGWDEFLQAEAVDEDLVMLVQLEAFGGFLTAASVVFADEFHLQRLLLSEPVTFTETDETKEALSVLERLFAEPIELLTVATGAGILEVDNQHERVVRWITALNGVLLVDNLGPLNRHLFRAQHLARALTADLLVGWGASRPDVEVAASHVERLSAIGPLAPSPH